MQRTTPAYRRSLSLALSIAAAILNAMASPSSAATLPSGSVGAAAPGQDWWMCRYQDPRDPNKPVLGSRMYYAVIATGAASNESSALNAHFNAYVQQHDKVHVDVTGGKGFCVRVSNDAAVRANSMDLFLKQWASSNIQSIRVGWTNTPAENAAIDAKVAAVGAASPRPPIAQRAGPFIACSTSGGAGINTFITGVFQTASPVTHLPNGGNLVDQSVLDRFYAYLTQKGYRFKAGSNYGCVVEPTEAQARAAERQRYESGGCSNCGTVVETGWKDR